MTMVGEHLVVSGNRKTTVLKLMVICVTEIQKGRDGVGDGGDGVGVVMIMNLRMMYVICHQDSWYITLVNNISLRGKEF